MVYAPGATQSPNKSTELPILLDPTLLGSARRIYRTYRVLHPRQNRQPFGVAIHSKTHRGQLIFREKPILLPGEHFVSAKHLDAEIY